MASGSTKPYLIRALYEWCSDNGHTPYLSVRVDATTRVPLEFVRNGEIVLNVSASATRNLTMNNEAIQFTARFSGVSREVSVPIEAVSGIFAKETGQGMMFPPEPPSATSQPGQPAADAPLSTDGANLPRDTDPPPLPPPAGGRGRLKIVK